jgi:hypothetical protein
MKQPSWLLLSLALNAVLVLGLGWVWRPHTGPANTAEEAPMAPAVAAPAEARRSSTSQAAADPRLTPFATEAVDWSRFSTGDWPRFRDELVACGCPRPTVRHILVPLVNRHFSQRLQAAAAEVSTRFWEVLCPPARERKEVWEKQFEALDSERKAVLAQLFPGNWTESADPPAPRPDTRLNFLPPGLADQVLAAETNEDALIDEARNTQTEPQLQEELIQQARAAFEAELTRLLSPEELAEWRARNSNRADWAKSMEGVELSPSELAEIARLADTDRARGNPPATSAAEKETAIKALLGPERFAEFERAQDGTYQQWLSLSRRTGLGESELNTLWQKQKDVQAQAKQLVGDPALSAADRTAELTALRAQHEELIRESLAPNPGAFEAWQRQQTQWLKETFSLPVANPVQDWLKQP